VTTFSFPAGIHMWSDILLQRPRLSLLVLGSSCLAVVAAVAALGTWFQLEVCAMCWFQRLVLLLAGTGFLLAAAWPRAQRVTLRLGEFGLLLGLASAARQTYLLFHIDSASGSCGAGLLYYLQIGNYEAFFRAGLLGGLDCATHQPLILGLYLPQWSLLAFCGLLAAYAAGMLVCARNGRSRQP